MNRGSGIGSPQLRGCRSVAQGFLGAVPESDAQRLKAEDGAPAPLPTVVARDQAPFDLVAHIEVAWRDALVPGEVRLGAGLADHGDVDISGGDEHSRVG